MRASDDKWRQKTQRKIVSAIDEQAALHGFADKRRTFDGKFNADDQAFARDLADEAEFCGKLRETFAQFGTTQADILDAFFLLDNFEELERHGASQRAAADGRAMHPGRNARTNRLGAQH